jgi:hypothetical protein
VCTIDVATVRGRSGVSTPLTYHMRPSGMYAAIEKKTSQSKGPYSLRHLLENIFFSHTPQKWHSHLTDGIGVCVGCLRAPSLAHGVP